MDSHVLWWVSYNGKIQLDDMMGEGGESLYILQADNNNNNKKVCTLNFTIFKNNYLELCVHFY
jgi:hypothetical protein